MAKAPRAGQVKTRLCPPLTADRAAALAGCFARDTAHKALALGYPVFVAYAPADGRAMLEPLLPPGLLWLPQRGDNLGTRIQAAFDDVDAQGFSPLLMLGTDSPTLPPAFLKDARTILSEARADVVLGPADDGGYYLFGLRQPAPGLLEGVAWSTPRALADTRRNAKRLGLRVALLPRWYDVDTAADLQRLRTEFETDTAARERAPFTYDSRLV